MNRQEMSRQEMSRQEICKHATEWIREDTINRSMIFLASDNDTGEYIKSAVVGGTIDAMATTILDVMSQNLRFADAVKKAARLYEEDNKKLGIK